MLFGIKISHILSPTVVDWINVFTRKTYRDIVIELFGLLH
jgi:hypothetical protein